MKTFYENVLFAVEEKKRLDYLLESAQEGNYLTEEDRDDYINLLKSKKNSLWAVLAEAVECERKNPGRLQPDLDLPYLDFCSTIGKRYDSRKED